MQIARNSLLCFVQIARNNKFEPSIIFAVSFQIVTRNLLFAATKLEKGGRKITEFAVLLGRNHSKMEEFLEIKFVQP